MSPQKMFACWFNTRFFLTDEEIQNNVPTNNTGDNNRILTFNKGDLDKACKDTKHKDYSDTFRMDVVFHQV